MDNICRSATHRDTVSLADRTPAALMRVRAVAAELGITVRRAYQLIEAGDLPHTRIGARTIRVPRPAFEAWLAAHAERAVSSLGRRP
jgi:excisionase family DNA binding protein